VIQLKYFQCSDTSVKLQWNSGHNLGASISQPQKIHPASLFLSPISNRVHEQEMGSACNSHLSSSHYSPQEEETHPMKIQLGHEKVLGQ
jgi:hypothetical protein